MWCVSARGWVKSVEGGKGKLTWSDSAQTDGWWRAHAWSVTVSLCGCHHSGLFPNTLDLKLPAKACCNYV